MDSYVEVKNLNGTSGRVPNDAATWKEFWENETGRKFGMCSCKDCTSRAEVGAHVQKAIRPIISGILCHYARRIITKQAGNILR